MKLQLIDPAFRCSCKRLPAIPAMSLQIFYPGESDKGSKKFVHWKMLIFATWLKNPEALQDCQ